MAKKITIFNPAAATILKLPIADYAAKSAADVLKEYPWFVKTLEDTLASKSTVSRQETSFPIASEEAKIGYTTILIRDPHQSVLGSGMIFQRLTH